jgi:hypothetical protein
MKRLFGFLAIIAMSTASAAELFFPDPKDTPGALSPEVTEENILQTVCQSTWLESNRPSASYIDELKAKQVEALQLKGGPADYEEDHLVPLCAGGHPTDPRNLWPQPASGDWNYKVKDGFETFVCKSLCRGNLTLRAAQEKFLEADWRRRYMQWVQVE